MNKFIPAALVLAASIATGAHAAGAMQNTDLLGEAVAADMASRTLQIQPDTQYVNVRHGEVVRFTAGNGQQFTYNFDGASASTDFDLRRVAPAGMLDHEVIAYVQPGPLDDGGR